MNSLPVRVLSQKLDQRFRILTSGDRAALPRHQTMRALIDWSYDLLTPPEQRLFERLSIFAGGCTLDTAAAVNDNQADEFGVLELLVSLVDKSLVVADLAAREPRYRLLESVREYSREKLIARGEENAVARRHALAFLELAEKLDVEYPRHYSRAWLARVEAEMENWQSALSWSLDERRDVITGQRLTVALSWAWTHFALTEDKRRVRTGVALVDGSTPRCLAAQLQYAEAALAAVSIDFRATLSAAMLALATYRELDDSRGAAKAQHMAGLALVRLGQLTEGEPLLREALETARTLGDQRLVGNILGAIGNARFANGDIVAARLLYAEGNAVLRSVNADLFATSWVLNLAEAEFCAGNAETALQHATDALATHRIHGGQYFVAYDLTDIAGYLIALDRYDEARTQAREALKLTHELELDVLFNCALQHLAAIAALESRDIPPRSSSKYKQAARLVGFIDAGLKQLGSERWYIEQQELERILSILTDVFDTAELKNVMAEGASMTDDQVIQEALVI